MQWKVGQRVRATRKVTESGDPNGHWSARFPDPMYIHACKGDFGTVEHVNDEGTPDVRFDRTGTSTIVGDDEVELLEGEDDGEVESEVQAVSEG